MRMNLLSDIHQEVKHCLIIVLIILAFAGYIAAEWPNDYGRVSREWVESVYWADR